MKQEWVPRMRCVATASEFSRSLHSTVPACGIQNPWSQWSLARTPGPAEPESESSLTQGILSPSHSGEAVAQKGKGLAQSHTAGEGCGWSLNPVLLASETQLSPRPLAPGIRHLFSFSLLA